MCGIAGIITKSENYHLLSKIENMLKVITHRGPDGKGIECFDNRIVLGHRRLSIIDLSENGKQPMEYNGKYWITSNGEIYNYLELKKELSKEGYQLPSHCDTEVILAAYDKWGLNCM